MNAPGKVLLMVTSILLIVFGCISVYMMLTYFGIILIYGGSNLLGLLLFLYTIAFCVAELVMGIIGVILCGKPHKAKFFIVSGSVICVLGGIHIIIGLIAGTFQITNLLGFVLPMLFIGGGNMNKNAWQPPDSTNVTG